MKSNATPIRGNSLRRALRSLGTLCLLGVCGLASLPQAHAQAPYIDTSTVANTADNYTDLTKKDNHPKSLYFVTNNWNPTGKAEGVYNNSPIGVFFFAAIKDWVIFDGVGSLPVGAAFNVLSVPAGDNVYVHTATAGNVANDYTILDNVHTNNNPNALVWVTPSFSSSYIYTTPIGVAYDGSAWVIFNEDETPIPLGTTFNVIIADGSFSPQVFVQKATSSNIAADHTILNDSLINASTGHQLMVTPNWNPGGVGGTYDKAPIGVYYDTVLKKYCIFNEDNSAMPVGASFNVWVLK